MKIPGKGLLLTSVAAGIVLGVTVTSLTLRAPVVEAQSSVDRLPRTRDGRPDLSGVWQALSPAAGDLEDHSAEEGAPAGQGVVEGGDIPYQPSALAKKQEHWAKRQTLDPLSKCFLPGVPRATYLPFPFEIVQTPGHVAIFYEFLHATRMVYVNGSGHPDALEFWMGDSRGRWEGDTLVVDVTDFNDQTWFDKAGNFHSEDLHVVERYTPMSANHLRYEATIDDPKVFTKPWKISMPLYRRLEKDVEILDYECLGFVEPSPTLEQFRQLGK